MKHRENKAKSTWCHAMACDDEQNVFLCTSPRMFPHECVFAFAGKLHQVIAQILAAQGKS